jgi:ATP-dependent Clp protease ATP-binding subunit ClpA
VIVFKQLGRADCERIVNLELSTVEKRLEEKSLALDIDEDVRSFLIEKGFDPQYGARPLKRTIQRYLEDPLAEELIAGHFKSGVPIHVSVEGEHLKFTQAQKVAT